MSNPQGSPMGRSPSRLGLLPSTRKSLRLAVSSSPGRSPSPIGRLSPAHALRRPSPEPIRRSPFAAEQIPPRASTSLGTYATSDVASAVSAFLASPAQPVEPVSAEQQSSLPARSHSRPGAMLIRESVRRMFESSDKKHSALHALILRSMLQSKLMAAADASIAGLAGAEGRTETGGRLKPRLLKGLSHSEYIVQMGKPQGDGETLDPLPPRPTSAGDIESAQLPSDGTTPQESKRTMRRLKLLFTHLYEQLSVRRRASNQSVVQYDTLTSDAVFGLERSDSTVTAETAASASQLQSPSATLSTPMPATAAAAAGPTRSLPATTTTATAATVDTTDAAPLGRENSFNFSNSDDESSVDEEEGAGLDESGDESSTGSSGAYAASLGGGGRGGSATGVIGYNRKRRSDEENDNADGDDGEEDSDAMETENTAQQEQDTSSVVTSTSAIAQPGSRRKSQGLRRHRSIAKLLGRKTIVLDKLLGRGAAGEVYVGRVSGVTETDEPLVAVKQVFLEGIRDVDAFVSLLWLEADMLGELHHPNIVGFRGVYYSAQDAVFNLVMEYCEGGTLAALLRRRGTLSTAEIARALSDVLAGLAYLHKHSIIHRDIKPNNVLLRKGTAKIADFGCSTRALELARSCVGTPWYLAPEVARAEPHSYAADIWSLGCVALELATGKRLYSDMHAFAVIIRLAQGATEQDPRPIPHEQLDPLVDDFVTRCLVEDWRKRPSSEELLSHPLLSMGRDLSATWSES